MRPSDNSGRMMGTTLMVVGTVLAVLGIAWMVTNAMSGILQPGGFVLGLIFLSVIVIPMVLAGRFLRQRGTAEDAETAVFEQRRKLLDRDKIFRQLLQRESYLVAGAVGDAISKSDGEARENLRQAQSALLALQEAASAPVGEAAWLESSRLNSRDERDVVRYDDLLLAGLRRIREEVGEVSPLDATAAQSLLGMARAAQRQFDLRQDLVLRGRRLPPVSPLHILKGEVPDPSTITPQSLRPGAAVSMGKDDYLVTARITYFAEGKEWYALALSGEGGERRLQVEPSTNRVLIMEPADTAALTGNAEESGTASVSIDGLQSSAEGLVVDFRGMRSPDGLVGWWERWPDGERTYVGRAVGSTDLQFWPAAVGG